MASKCRLCSSSLMLFNVFELHLQDFAQLKRCIELSTGLSVQEDGGAGYLLCKNCCDIATLCFKFRINSQRNALLLKDGPKSRTIVSQPIESLAKNKIVTNSSHIPNVQNYDKHTKDFQTEISKSVSQILLRYPTLNIPTSVYNLDISPYILMKDIRADLKKYAQNSTNTHPTFSVSRSYQITNMDTTKLRFKKLGLALNHNHVNNSESYARVSSPDLMSDSSSDNDTAEAMTCSEEPSLSRVESECLLVPVNYMEEFVCRVCNKVLNSDKRLQDHLLIHHRIEKSNGEKPVDVTSTNKNDVCDMSEMSEMSGPSPTVETPEIQLHSEERPLTPNDTPRRPLVNLPVIRITPIENQEHIRRQYPNLFINSDETNSIITSAADTEYLPPTEPDVESIVLINSDSEDEIVAESKISNWTKNVITESEKQKLKEIFRSFLHRRIPEKQIVPANVNSVETQTTSLFDTQFKLDPMGLNDMNILQPELKRYNIPVTFLKQTKDFHAFFIQYSTSEPFSKPIDWSKIPKVDLLKPVDFQSTVTNNAINNLNISNNVEPVSMDLIV